MAALANWYSPFGHNEDVPWSNRMESWKGSTVLKGRMTEENDFFYGILWTCIRTYPLFWPVYNGLVCSVWLHLAEKCIQWLNSTPFLEETNHQMWQCVRLGESCKDSCSTGDLGLVIKPSELAKCNNRKAVGEKWCSKLMGGCLWTIHGKSPRRVPGGSSDLSIGSEPTPIILGFWYKHSC